MIDGYGFKVIPLLLLRRITKLNPCLKMAVSEWWWIVKIVLLSVFFGEEIMVVSGWRGSHLRRNDSISSARTTLWSTSIASRSNSLATSNVNVLPMGEADVCFRKGAELEKIGQVRHYIYIYYVFMFRFAIASIYVNIQ